MRKKQKLLWAAGISLGLLVVVAAGLVLAAKFYFTGERLKALVIPRIEAYSGRKAGIGEIRFSIFKGGLVIREFSLKERDGQRDFVRAEGFVLSYRLLPLLRRQIVIDELGLDSPYVFVKRDKDGGFNFSDIVEKGKVEKEKKEKQKAPEERMPEKAKAFAVAVNKITVKDLKAEFVDEMGEIPPVSAHADMRLSLLVPKEAEGRLAVAGSMDLKSLKAKIGKEVVDTSGSIKMEMDGAVAFKLQAVAAGDKINLTGRVKDFYTGSPDVSLDVTAAELNVERLMSVAAGFGGKPRRPSVSKKAAPAAAPPVARRLKAAGKIAAGTMKYKEYSVKSFSMPYRYSGGALSVEPLTMSFTGGGAKHYVSGGTRGGFSLNALGGAEAVKGSVKGNGLVKLERLEFKRSPLGEQISFILGIPDISATTFRDSEIRYDIRNKMAFFEGFIVSEHLEFKPLKGTVGFDKRVSATVDARVSPGFSARMPGRLSGLLADPKGWVTVPLKVGGSTDKPSVGINEAALSEALGRRIERGIKERLIEKFIPPAEKRQEEPKQPPPKSPEEFLREIFK